VSCACICALMLVLATSSASFSTLRSPMRSSLRSHSPWMCDDSGCRCCASCCPATFPSPSTLPAILVLVEKASRQPLGGDSGGSSQPSVFISGTVSIMVISLLITSCMISPWHLR